MPQNRNSKQIFKTNAQKDKMESVILCTSMEPLPMQPLIIYSRADCHLCDVAEALLHSCGLADGYRKVDIESDLNLLRRYGIRIPVLMNEASGAELFWPFDRDAVIALAGGKQ